MSAGANSKDRVITCPDVTHHRPTAIAISLMSVAVYGEREPRAPKLVQSPHDDQLAISKAQSKRDKRNAKRLEIARRNNS